MDCEVTSLSLQNPGLPMTTPMYELNSVANHDLHTEDSLVDGKHSGGKKALAAD